MADYQKLYALLCGVIDDVIDPLERIPLALPYTKKLRHALEQAEELYIDTSAYSAAEHENVIVLQREGEQR